MKKISAVLGMLLSLCLFVSSAAAAETKSGTIKAVDAKASSITFRANGAAADEVLKVDAAVDLKAVKANTKAQITVDAGVVKEIKAKASAPGY
jgi:carbon monoxide dehydrogenase subunit G